MALVFKNNGQGFFRVVFLASCKTLVKALHYVAWPWITRIQKILAGDLWLFKIQRMVWQCLKEKQCVHLIR